MELRKLGDLTAKEVQEILDAVNWQEVAWLYITAEFRTLLVIWTDAWVTTLHPGTSLTDNTKVLLAVRCPGFANLDQAGFTDGFVEWDEEREAFVSILPGEEGRVVGGILDVVRECIEDGTLADEVRDELSALAFAQWKEEKERERTGKAKPAGRKQALEKQEPKRAS